MRVLIDMDGVIADFEKGFLDNWRKKYPDKISIPLEQRTTFHAEEQYPTELKKLARAIYEEKGFFLSLQPISGGIEAIKEMNNSSIDIFICTSPISKYQHCVPEKYEWIDKHLGQDWVKKIVITKDKTIVDGNFLIDDKPEITGVNKPSWEQILYEQPYNVCVKYKKRITWKNWKTIFPQYKLFYEKRSIYNKKTEWHDSRIIAFTDDDAINSALDKITKLELHSASTLISKAYLETQTGAKIKVYDASDDE